MLKSCGGKAFLQPPSWPLASRPVVTAPSAGTQEASFQVNEEDVSGIEFDGIITLFTATTRLTGTLNGAVDSVGWLAEQSIIVRK